MNPVSTQLEMSAAGIRLAGYLLENNIRMAQIFGGAVLQANPFVGSVEVRKLVSKKASTSVGVGNTTVASVAEDAGVNETLENPAAKPKQVRSAPLRKTATAKAKTAPDSKKPRRRASPAAPGKPAIGEAVAAVAPRSTAPSKSPAKVEKRNVAPAKKSASMTPAVSDTNTKETKTPEFKSHMATEKKAVSDPKPSVAAGASKVTDDVELARKTTAANEKAIQQTAEPRRPRAPSAPPAMPVRKSEHSQD